MVLLAVICTLYVSITIVVFTPYAMDWYDFRSKETARDALKALVWPVSLVFGFITMWKDAFREEDRQAEPYRDGDN